MTDYRLPCLNCRHPGEAHLGEKCLFGPGGYRPLSRECFDARLYREEDERLRRGRRGYYARYAARNKADRVLSLDVEWQALTQSHRTLRAICTHPPEFQVAFLHDESDENTTGCSLCRTPITRPLS